MSQSLLVDTEPSTAFGQTFAWQGWSLVIPDDWNPVRVVGDHGQGSVLFADLIRPRLGVRWRTAARGGNAMNWAVSALRNEVGELAAGEAVDVAILSTTDQQAAGEWKIARLYTETDPPGRDVFVGWSVCSERVIEIVHHVKQRDRQFADKVLPTLRDTPSAHRQHWSVFDLSCTSPAGWALRWYRLHAGDLTLAFGHKPATMMLRQVGPAKLALARQPVEKWIAQQDKRFAKLYRPPTTFDDFSVVIDGRSFGGRQGRFVRRRRLFWAVTVPKVLTAVAVEETVRNRLLIASGTDPFTVTELLLTAGSVAGARIGSDD